MTGSGVIVDGAVITNRHLVEGAVDIRYRQAATGLIGRVGWALVDGAGPDLATLVPAPPPGSADGETADGAAADGAVADRAVAGVARAAGDPPVGEPVIVAASVGGVLVVDVGRIHAYTSGSAYGPGRVMLLEPATSPGYSGGPVLDRNGEIVAVLRAVDTATGLAVAVPASEITTWHRGRNDVNPSPRCWAQS